MRAILPGRPQSTRQALCTADWDGLRLVAYISGDTVVVLDGKRNILQTIYVDDVESLQAVTINESSGCIALSDENDAYIYNPLGRDEGVLRWAQAHKLQSKDASSIACLSWGLPEELLVCGTNMTVWSIQDADDPQRIWTQEVANPIAIAIFSPDAGLIASCSKHDRIVKMWRRLSYEMDGTRFDVSYLQHPAAVTNMHWRKPWHSEQSLDNLLYTFCADNQIRVWSHSDHQPPFVMQKIATLDMNQSIQPRRLSASSMSKVRYAFIFDSRDFSSATEKAIQASRLGTDHALEHLIEVANRSPEICVILDGLGHMSVWGLENAGYKNKATTERFNVALVDGVDIRLPSDQRNAADYVQFTSFAGGGHPSSISVLVHSYAGQIDWYEGSISEFFDTSSRLERTRLVSSWSGHDSAVESMVRSDDGKIMLSWTDEGSVIVWTQSSSGALLRSSHFEASSDVLDALILGEYNCVLLLESDTLSFWDISCLQSKKIAETQLPTELESDPLFVIKVSSDSETPQRLSSVVFYENGQCQVFSIYLPKNSTSKESNGYHKLLSMATSTNCGDRSVAKRYVRCTELLNASAMRNSCQASTVSVTREGLLEAYEGFVDTSGSLKWKQCGELVTRILKPSLVRPLSNGKVVIIDASGKQLSVWDFIQGCCEYVTLLHSTDPVEKVEWTSTVHSNLVFAASYAHGVDIFAQAPYCTYNASEPWVHTHTIRLRDYTTHPTGDVCWLLGSDLCVGAGNQIFVLEVDNSYESESSKDAHTHTFTHSLARDTDLNNSELPAFHPHSINHLLWRNKYPLVETILRKLCKTLKYYTAGDELASDLNISTSMLALPPARDSKHQNLVEEESNEHDADADLDEVACHLEESIAKVGLHQLGSKEKEEFTLLLPPILEIRDSQRSLDDNALKYLYALRTVPADESLPWSAFVAASLSTSQEALLDIISRRYDSKITWQVARRLGLFLWLSEPETVRTQLENVARAEYNKDPDNRSPVDCSIYYLALNKKQVLIGLWRTTLGIREKENTMKLLRNNFEEPRWKQTALKNAYALLSKRRFEYAAAFFLLGGNLPDAVNVCVNQMEDFQLAVAIARAWDHDEKVQSEVMKKLLDTTLLRMAADRQQGRWMAAWGLCYFRNWSEAIRVTALPACQAFDEDHLSDVKGIPQSMFVQSNDPKLVDLYLQLREKLFQAGDWTEDTLSPTQEWAFVIRTAQYLARAGMSTLALRLVRNWEFVPWQKKQGKVSGVETATRRKSEAGTIGDTGEFGKDMEVNEVQPKKPPPTQFIEPSADSLLDSFGF